MITLVAAFLISASASTFAHEGDKHENHGEHAKANKKAKAYPLDTCAVTGEKLDDHGSPYVFAYKDQEVKLCCKGCLKDFKKEPEKHMKKVQEEASKKKSQITRLP